MTIDPLLRELCLKHRDAIPNSLLRAIRSGSTEQEKPKPVPPPRPYQFRVAEGVAVTAVPVPHWRKILREVAEKRGLRASAILARSRTKPISHARQEVMFRMKTEAGMSLPDIGRRLGGYDHTTILHGIRAHVRRSRLPSWYCKQFAEAAHG